MIYKKSIGSRIFDLFNYLFMLGVIVVTVYPMFYVLVCSLSDSSSLIGTRGLILFPKGFNIAAYAAVFGNPNIFSGYRVTLFVVVVGTVLSVAATAIGAFLITRKSFRIRKVLSYMMVFTMYFSGGMIPKYLMVYKWLHLGDSVWALILPVMISTYNLAYHEGKLCRFTGQFGRSGKNRWR